MQDKNITITVSGERKSGKSNLIFLLKKLLKENGFNIQFEGGIDFKNETQFDEAIGRNFSEAIKSIKETGKIELKEVTI